MKTIKAALVIAVLAVTNLSLFSQVSAEIATEIIDLFQTIEKHTDYYELEEAISKLQPAKELVLEHYGSVSEKNVEILLLQTNIHIAQPDFNAADSLLNLLENLTNNLDISSNKLLQLRIQMAVANKDYEFNDYDISATKWEAIVKQFETQELTNADQYPMALCGLANCYVLSNRTEKSEPLISKAMGLCEEKQGKTNMRFAELLRAEAQMNFYQKNYQKSIELFDKSNELIEKLDGVGNDLMVKNQILKVWCLISLSDFNNVERILLDLLKLHDRKNDSTSSNVGHTAYALSTLYYYLQQFERAEEYAVKTLAVYSEVYGDLHSKSLKAINLLGIMNLNLGRYDKAEFYYLKIIECHEKKYSKETIFYTTYVNNLASLYMKIQRYEEADSLFRVALQILEKIDPYDKGIIKYARNLGNVNTTLKKYEIAEKYYLRAEAVQKKMYGPEHIEFLQSSFWLGLFYHAILEQPEKAHPVYLNFYDNLKTHLRNNFVFLNEREQEIYFQRLVDDLILTMYASLVEFPYPAFYDLHYEIALFRKGIYLRTHQSKMKSVLAQELPSLNNKYEEFLKIQKEIANLSKNTPSERVGLADLENEKLLLEKEISRSVPMFEKELLKSNVTKDEVQANLKNGEAAIEFIRFPYVSVELDSFIYYAALIIKKDNEHVDYIRLFDEKLLLEILNNEEETIRGPQGDLLTARGEKLKKKHKRFEDLYPLIWEPMDSVLNDIHTVYTSSTGLLHRLNLSAMPLNDSTLLSDQINLQVLSSTGALVGKNETAFSFKEAMVFGGIDYNTTEGEKGVVNWEYLPATEQEATEVSEILKQNSIVSKYITGNSANEATIKTIGVNAKSPEILHFATHAFYYDVNEEKENNLPFYKTAEDPLFRAGIVLSGANSIDNGTINDANPNASTVYQQEDGILTAYEIANMNLSNTKLVVLSACDTGLGEIHEHEGVYGLQRAFKMAGAQNIVMSLWPVPDEQTMELMVFFYKELFTKSNTNISSALQKAQNQMRMKYPDNPGYWAGFVAIN